MTQQVSIASTGALPLITGETFLASAAKSTEVWSSFDPDLLREKLKEALDELNGQTNGTLNSDLAAALAPILAQKLSYRVQ